MESICGIFNNETIIIGFVVWILTQLLKFVFYSVVNKQFCFSRLLGLGGMPSSHTALVTSMVITTGRLKGTTSTEFSTVFFLAIIVILDAMGVRRAAGEQAKIINKIVDFLFRLSNKDETVKKLKEFLGHTPVEVIGGIIVGVFGTWITGIMFKYFYIL